MVDPDKLRLVYQPMDVSARCPSCGFAMWTERWTPVQIVHCIGESCPDKGVRFRVKPPQYALEELG